MSRYAVLAVTLCALLFVGCGGSTQSSTGTPATVVPTITAQPANQAVTAPATATFSVTATGTAPLSYQWSRGGTAISGATSSTYTTPATSSTDNGSSFTVVVTNSAGSATSAAAVLTVNPAVTAPTITTQPVSQTVTAPATATFTVAASGTAPLTYQWSRNGSNISGATNVSYTTGATSTADSGSSFVVTVGNAAGTLSSNAVTLTVNPATVVGPNAIGPVILGYLPASQTVIPGGNATFSVNAIGDAPLSYQWNENGAPISGATSSTYTKSNVSSADNGALITATVTNPANTLISQPATLTVAANQIAPYILLSPKFISVGQGQSATFTTLANGTQPLSYQWLKNGSAISGATGYTYTTPPTTMADNNAVFSVTISNSAGSVTSQPANPASPANLVVVASPNGLGGFGPVFPSGVTDITGIQYSFQVVTDNAQTIRIIFGSNTLTAPGGAFSAYQLQTNLYADRITYADGGCTTFPLLGTEIYGQASIRNAITDNAFQQGLEPGVSSSINTSDPTDFPVQTYIVDGIPNDYKSDSISQFNITGLQGSVSIQRGATITDVSAFTRCGLVLVPGTYRVWTITTQLTGHPTVTNQVVALDAEARYLLPGYALQFFSEFLGQTGTYTVQLWNFAYARESAPAFQPISTFNSLYVYDGNSTNYGIHIVGASGQDRIEFSNVPGVVYIPGNTLFSYTPQP